jgi:hypothetical protein
MKAQKNWLYAYRNLKELYKELVPHLERSNLEVPEPLDEQLDPRKTPAQLKNCIDKLKINVGSMKSSTFLEKKLTGMLLERFIEDIEYFNDDLSHELEALGSVFISHEGKEVICS